MLLYLVLRKQTFAFQKYTVYTYSVAIDTNIYKERSRLEWNSLEKNHTRPSVLALPQPEQPGSPAVNSMGLLQNTTEENHTLGDKIFPYTAEVWNWCCLFPSPPFNPVMCLSICIPHPNPPQPPCAARALTSLRAELSFAPKRKMWFPDVWILSVRLPRIQGSWDTAG